MTVSDQWRETGKLHFLQKLFQGIQDRHLDAKVGFRAARAMADWKSFGPVTSRT